MCIASALVVVTATASIACAQESDAARVSLDRAVAFAGGFDRVYGMTTLVVSSVVRRETGGGPLRRTDAHVVRVSVEGPPRDRRPDYSSCSRASTSGGSSRSRRRPRPRRSATCRSAQFFAEIEAMRIAGITAGCTLDTFCPEANVTRRQMAAFFARALGLYWGF